MCIYFYSGTLKFSSSGDAFGILKVKYRFVWLESYVVSSQIGNDKKKQFGRPVLCDSAISDHSIVPPPPHTPISAKSSICHCVEPLFLGYRSDLKHAKSNYRHTLFSKHYFTLNTPVLSLLKALYYIVAKSENGSVTKDYILICEF